MFFYHLQPTTYHGNYKCLYRENLTFLRDMIFHMPTLYMCTIITTNSHIARYSCINIKIIKIFPNMPSLRRPSIWQKIAWVHDNKRFEDTSFPICYQNFKISYSYHFSPLTLKCYVYPISVISDIFSNFFKRSVKKRGKYFSAYHCNLGFSSLNIFMVHTLQCLGILHDYAWEIICGRRHKARVGYI